MVALYSVSFVECIDMMDYMLLAFGAWFAGFFPLLEIVAAVPLALAAGLDTLSAVFWTVFGNFTPILLIDLFYVQMRRSERVKRWLDGLVSEKAQARLNRYGVWFILVATPIVGVWAMGVAGKLLKIERTKLFTATFVSIFVYALILAALIQWGANTLT